MGGSVFTFAGGKGGVGKTTTTANVGVALAKEGFEVAVVDADIGMTNLGRFLGVRQDVGIHKVLAGRTDLESILVRGPAGVAVVPGEQGLPPTEAADPANLGDVVDPLRERADLVLIDTGAGVSHGTLVACGLADGVVLVTTPDDVAVGDTGKSAELAAHVDTPVLGTVLTRATVDVDVDAVVAGLDHDAIAAVPEYRAKSTAEPRILEAPESPAAAEYERLATTLAVCHKTGDFAEPVASASEATDAPADAGVPGASDPGTTAAEGSEVSDRGGAAGETGSDGGATGTDGDGGSDGGRNARGSDGPLRGLLRRLSSRR